MKFALVEPPEITALVLKIAARCNINCDYCYVFQHADQSYKQRPRIMSLEHVEQLAGQVNVYLNASGVHSMHLSLHGGEPLLGGVTYLEDVILTFKKHVKQIHKISFSVQTNGVLLNRKFLDLFREHGVQVALSLDGPASANDKHRLDFKGRSTYESVERALDLLENEYREIFSGIISVIDPSNDPREIIDYFAEINPPSYDMLLPDANHCVPPPGRDKNADLYVDWMQEAFCYWYNHCRQLRLRTFLNAYSGVIGMGTESEMFGDGSTTYLVIETDGNYHYSDLLKSTYEGASDTGLHVKDTSILEVVDSPVIRKYQTLQLSEMRCETCLRCPEVEICGSGQIAHRYSADGFNNPTVYCREMMALIRLARHFTEHSYLQEILKTPSLNETPIVERWLSDQAYLILAYLTDKEPLQDAITEVGLTEVFMLIEKAFPAFQKEYVLLFPSGIEEGTGGEDVLEICERVLTKFLCRKFAIFQERYPLFLQPTDPAQETLFRDFYRDCYLYRFFQHTRANGFYEEMYDRLKILKPQLTGKCRQVSVFPLSDLGECLYRGLVEEFLPDEHLRIQQEQEKIKSRFLV